MQLTPKVTITKVGYLTAIKMGWSPWARPFTGPFDPVNGPGRAERG